MYVICRSTVFTLERKTPSATDVIRLENSHVVAMVSAETGSLHEVSLKDSGVSVKTDLHFVQYGTRAGKERSGAYLFLPDGAARVCLPPYTLQRSLLFPPPPSALEEKL